MLDRLKVPGALRLIGILAVIVALFFGGNTFHGIFGLPPSSPTFMKPDIKTALTTASQRALVFFLVELFDATGTLDGRGAPRRPAGA